MANKIHETNSFVSCNIYDGVGHGYLHLVIFLNFLNFILKYKFVPQAKKANQDALLWMKNQIKNFEK
jgi:hypothetical protein